MALRLIEIIAPANRQKEIHDLLKEQPMLGCWDERLSEERILVNLLVDAENVEAALDLLNGQFKAVEGFRAVLFNVEATLPRPEEPEKSEPGQLVIKAKEKPKPRISREELYADILDSTRLSWVYIVTIILSSIVAAIGILNNSIAIIIGAMVIAPLLGPNVALSLATTLGDIPLARNSVKTNLIGIATALVFSVVMGFIVSASPQIPTVAAATDVRLDSIILALASGSAGALAFTTGLSATLIGVMVAVALLPPLVTFGLLLGAGYWAPALTALQIFLINIICVNLAGVVTFLIQGIRPATWWEAEKAKVATRIAIAFWLFFLALLVVVTYFWHSWFKP
jgi:uncharacterized hydrophobic protein (TIGR00341 family)